MLFDIIGGLVNFVIDAILALAIVIAIGIGIVTVHNQMVVDYAPEIFGHKVVMNESITLFEIEHEGNVIYQLNWLVD